MTLSRLALSLSRGKRTAKDQLYSGVANILPSSIGPERRVLGGSGNHLIVSRFLAHGFASVVYLHLGLQDCSVESPGVGDSVTKTIFLGEMRRKHQSPKTGQGKLRAVKEYVNVGNVYLCSFFPPFPDVDLQKKGRGGDEAQKGLFVRNLIYLLIWRKLDVKSGLARGVASGPE